VSWPAAIGSSGLTAAPLTQGRGHLPERAPEPAAARRVAVVNGGVVVEVGCDRGRVGPVAGGEDGDGEHEGRVVVAAFQAATGVELLEDRASNPRPGTVSSRTARE
jgi:hypothetical protein